MGPRPPAAGGARSRVDSGGSRQLRSHVAAAVPTLVSRVAGAGAGERGKDRRGARRHRHGHLQRRPHRRAMVRGGTLPDPGGSVASGARGRAGAPKEAPSGSGARGTYGGGGRSLLPDSDRHGPTAGREVVGAPRSDQPEQAAATSRTGAGSPRGARRRLRLVQRGVRHPRSGGSTVAGRGEPTSTC